MHENRETSEAPEANFRDRPAGEGKSRTARMHAFEESDSGTVPMNRSNKSGKYGKATYLGDSACCVIFNNVVRPS